MPRTAAAGLRRRISPAGDRHAAFEAITVGTMAAASRITRGAVFGSVSEPLKTFPTRPWPANHIRRESNAPAPRNQPGRRATRGPRPMGTDTAARIHAVCVPVVENRLARLLRKWAYHPGTTLLMPEMALCTDVRVRLAGSPKSTAASDQ